MDALAETVRMNHSVALSATCLLVAVGFVALLAALVAHSRQQERAHQERLRYWAATNGWAYLPKPAVDWGNRLPGRNRSGVSVALSGTVGGRRVSVAEYSYTTSSTSGETTTTTTHHHVVIAVHLPQPYPTLAVQPRGMMSRFGRALFGDNATATGDFAFDTDYRVYGDPAAARQLVGPALRAEHVRGTVPAWSLAGTDLLTWVTGRLTAPERAPGMVVPLLRVADLLGLPR